LKEYRVSLANQLRYAWYYVPLLLLSTLALWWADSTNAAPVIVWVAFVVIVLPHFVLHFRYFSLSRNQGVTFDKAAGKITFLNDHSETSVASEDIRTVELTLPPPLSRQSPIWFPWQEYCYAIVVLVTGERFLITCLTVPGLRWPFEFERVEIKDSLYCWPPNVRAGSRG